MPGPQESMTTTGNSVAPYTNGICNGVVGSAVPLTNGFLNGSQGPHCAFESYISTRVDHGDVDNVLFEVDLGSGTRSRSLCTRCSTAYSKKALASKMPDPASVVPQTGENARRLSNILVVDPELIELAPSATRINARYNKPDEDHSHLGLVFGLENLGNIDRESHYRVFEENFSVGATTCAKY